VALASTINGAMPEYAVARIGKALNSQRKPLNGSRILVLGAAYKPGIADYRESPALDVMSLLLRAGAEVNYHDPFVSRVELPGRRLTSVALSDRILKAADCAVILTAHSEIDFKRVIRLSRLVFDARNATKGLTSSRVVRL
jgi:UDP-N-acetyl-D-glucosamine dehydrogenase